MASAVAASLESVREKIAEVCSQVGRDPAEVRIMAVTKFHGAEAVQECRDAGLTLFGENRVQEAIRKYGDLVPEVELHLIGHLQRNKAKLVPGLFSTVQSIDAPRTAEALATACRHAGRSVEILLEVNTSGEESKHGVANREELFGLIEEVAPYDELHVAGLMTIAPYTNDYEHIRGCFRRLRSLRDQAGARFPEVDFRELSMGMTNDYTVAIEEGSTLIRLGTALLGARTHAAT
ncbi:MAG: YggS family pyridoxal phosphate-dependent enzyme [Spirochaetaceae bacterium]